MKHLSYSMRFNSIRFSFITRSLNWFIERCAVNGRVLIVAILCRDWTHPLGLIANGSIRHWVLIMESAYYDRLRCRLHLLSYELCKQSMQQVLKYMFIYVCVCAWRCIYIHDLQAAVSSGQKGVQKVCLLCLCSCFTAAAICHKLKPNSVSYI